MKSEEHKNDIARRKFIYDDRDLKKMLSAIVMDKKPEIHSEIVKSLDIPKI